MLVATILISFISLYLIINQIINNVFYVKCTCRLRNNNDDRELEPVEEEEEEEEEKEDADDEKEEQEDADDEKEEQETEQDTEMKDVSVETEKKFECTNLNCKSCDCSDMPELVPIENLREKIVG
jgi:flagellar biosynthesis/type III secretory pathway M-ring protein FliF/YscJ